MHVAGLVDLPVCGINVSEREQPTGPVVPAAIAVPVSATSGWDAPEAVPTPPFPWLPDEVVDFFPDYSLWAETCKYVPGRRSEERRVGEECVSTVGLRWWG